MGWFLLVVALQILFESLPISSSGHVRLIELLASKFGGSLIPLTQTIDYLLHGPTMVIIALYFFPQWWPLVKHMYRCRYVIMHLLGVGFVAECATIIWYVFFSFTETSWFPLWLGFAITAILLGSLYFIQEGKQRMSIGKAFIIGCMQGLALLPGISRLGSTIVAGCWLGLPMRRAFTFSCALQWPLIVAGFSKGLYEGYKTNILGVPDGALLVTLVAASLGAYILLDCSWRAARNHYFWLFGGYVLVPFCIAVALTCV